MATAVRVVLPASTIGAPNTRAMAIITPYNRVDVPYAPRETSHGGLARTTEVVPRPMLRDLVRVGGPGLETLSFTLVVAYLNPYVSIEPILDDLKAIAKSGDPVTVRYGPQEMSHLWRLTDMKITGAMRRPDLPDYPEPPFIGFDRHRQPKDTGSPQDITRATVDLQFTELSDPLLRITPVAKAAAPKPPTTTGRPAPKPSTAPAARPPAPVTTTYIVKRGDTLSGIAGRLLGDTSRYREIATLNGITNPNRIYPGQVFRIPKR